MIMDTNRPDVRERSVEWEGGDPPCWAHLFDDEPPANLLPAPDAELATSSPATPGEISSPPVLPEVPPAAP
jgi:hypothetical protein